jgi:hypothetical protein
LVVIARPAASVKMGCSPLPLVRMWWSWSAIVAARELREPLRARGAARRPPVAVVVGLAHDLRDALCKPRLLLANLAQLASARRTATLQHPIHRRFRCSEHLFDRTSSEQPKVCRKCAEMQRLEALCRGASDAGSRLPA